MRTTVAIGLLVILASGCHNGIRVNAFLNAHKPVPARVSANMESYPGGPLCEIPVPPGDMCGQVKIAIIDVDGILANLNPVGPYSNGENSVGAFKEKLTAAAMDRSVQGVVLRINTPGGTVAATDLMYNDLQQFRAKTGKPVVACILDVGAGGGYYLASGCDRIVAIPSALVGGIGCIFNVYWGEKASEKFEFFERFIRSGESVDMGSPSRDLSKLERKLFADMAQSYHDQFKQAVLENRPTVAKETPVFDGRIMTASQAQEVGLIDGLGHLEDAVATVASMANLSGAATIMYCRQDQPARTPYHISSNRPLQSSMFPASIPGLERSRSNLFLYLWQADPTLLKLTGM